MMDPLVGAVCNPEEIWQMVDEMLVAQAQWLPQYGSCDRSSEETSGRGNSFRRAGLSRRGASEDEDGRRDEAGPRSGDPQCDEVGQSEGTSGRGSLVNAKAPQVRLIRACGAF